jgi:3-hydroxyacyl-[acyl-carrier-protein] dehydratase
VDFERDAAVSNHGADPIALGLPHRKPFLFLQEVTELEPGVRARARQVFDPADPIFGGHFPGDPIVPGVFLSEAIAQLAGIVAGAGQSERRFFLTALRSM